METAPGDVMHRHLRKTRLQVMGQRNHTRLLARRVIDHDDRQPLIESIGPMLPGREAIIGTDRQIDPVLLYPYEQRCDSPSANGYSCYWRLWIPKELHSLLPKSRCACCHLARHIARRAPSHIVNTIISFASHSLTQPQSRPQASGMPISGI